MTLIMRNMHRVASEVAGLYSDTYQAYIDKQYGKVILNSDKALMSYKGSNLMPKFDFLKALSIGKTSGYKSFYSSSE